MCAQLAKNILENGNEKKTSSIQSPSSQLSLDSTNRVETRLVPLSVSCSSPQQVSIYSTCRGPLLIHLPARREPSLHGQTKQTSSPQSPFGDSSPLDGEPFITLRRLFLRSTPMLNGEPFITLLRLFLRATPMLDGEPFHRKQVGNCVNSFPYEWGSGCASRR